MPPRTVHHLRYAALMLLLLSLAANRQEERKAGERRPQGRSREMPAAVIPVLGIRG